MLASTAALYGVSRATLYRALRLHLRPKAVRRADRGQPRKLSLAEIERYCEIIAALKLRTSNKKGRHVSTARAIELMTQHGVENAGRSGQARAGSADASDRRSLSARLGLRPCPPDAGSRRGPIPGEAVERIVAVRHEPFRSEAGQAAAVDRTRSRQSDLDAVQRRR